MKIGVSSYSFSKYMQATGANYIDICNIAKEYGFDGIEFIDLNLDYQPAESVTALAETIREHCAKIGLEIAAETPDEIAISIAAQMIECRAKSL